MRLFTLAFALLATTPSALAQPAALQPPVTYKVAVAPDLERLDIEACPTQSAPQHTFTAARGTQSILAPRRSSGGALGRRGDSYTAADWQAGECFQYGFDLAQSRQDGRSRNNGRRGDDIVTESRSWLLRPVGLSRAAEATIAFDVPPGIALSVPWRPLDRTTPHRRFKLGPTPPEWPTLAAFGHFDDSNLKIGGDALRPAVLGEVSDAQAATLRQFLALTAMDVAATFPRAFSLTPQIAFIGAGRQSESVPFGQSYRGGAVALLLYVDESRPLDDYLGNWTLTHELVHLIHPYLGDEGRWISEGIATYYQNVLRARSGRRTAQQAWDALEAGFRRGRSDVSGATLRDTSRQMNNGRHYMRAYWSGTALALLADVAWRTRAEDPTSLDAVLNRFVECCRSEQRLWGPREFVDRLDTLAGGPPVFGALFRAHAEQAAFPDVTPAYAKLGLSESSNADIAARALRQQIMTGRP